MKIRRIARPSDWCNISKLYKDAFPLSERKPLWLIRYAHMQKKADVWVIEKEGKFVGFAITMNADDMVMLDYFAVTPDVRGKGYGSKCLQWLQKRYKDYRFFLEIESVYVKAKNSKQRKNRKAFYYKNGMREVGIVAKVFGVELEALGHDCKLCFEEYQRLYRSCYGRLVGWNIRPVRKKGMRDS